METRKPQWRWLPYLSLILLVAGVALAIGAGNTQANYNQKLAQNRTANRIAERQRLDELEAAVRQGGAASLQSDKVQNLVRQLPYAGTSILVDADGRVICGSVSGDPGFWVSDSQQGQLRALREHLAKSHLARLLASLPPDTLTPGQRLLLENQYIVQAGDAYYYGRIWVGDGGMLADNERLLTDSQGNLVGAAAVAYYVRGTVRYSPPLYNALTLGFTVALLLYWLSLPLWVFLDARARGERAWLWAALALAGNLLGVITYLLVRRPGSGVCPNCSGKTRPRDNVCPQCGQRLQPVCSACNEPLEAGWQYCPHCAARLVKED